MGSNLLYHSAVPMEIGSRVTVTRGQRIRVPIRSLVTVTEVFGALLHLSFLY